MKKFPIFLFSFYGLSLLGQTSNLPLISLNTNGTEIPGNPKIEVHMGIVNNANGVNSLSDPFNEYDGIIGIETRGSSSSSWPKKSYSFETRNADGSNLNVSLLGMPEENDWVLYGPYADKSLIRNALTFELGSQLGRWTPQAKFCELYIDDAYTGVYLLIEKIKKDGGRLDIATLNPDEISGDDLTGGYLLKIDRPDNYWISDYPSPVGNYPVPISYVYPDFGNMPQEQKDYIKNFMDEFEDVLAGSGFMNPDLGYRKYIDVESFVDYFLINELARNVDAYRLSTYFYKDRDSRGGKLTMGPLWDFNFSFGNADYYDAFMDEGWMIHTVPAYDGYQAPFWWDRLREDPYFNASLRLRWESLRQTTFSKASIESKIDSLTSLIDAAQSRNFLEYPILGVYVWPNYYVGDTYTSEIDFLKNWVNARIDWMDIQLGSINNLDQESFAVNTYEVSVFPNPFIDEIGIHYYAFQPCQIEIRMLDIMGRNLSNQKQHVEAGYHEARLEIGDQAGLGGIFCLQFFVDGKLVKTEKLIHK